MDLHKKYRKWVEGQDKFADRVIKAKMEKRKKIESVPYELPPISELETLLKEISEEIPVLKEKYKGKTIRTLKEKDFESTAKEIAPHIKPFLSYPENANIGVSYGGKYGGRSAYAVSGITFSGDVEIYEKKLYYCEFVRNFVHELFHLDGWNESYAEFHTMRFLEEMNEIAPKQGLDLIALRIRIVAIGHTYAYQRRVEIESKYKNRFKRWLLGRRKSKPIIKNELEEMKLGKISVLMILEKTYPKLRSFLPYHLQAKIGNEDVRGPYTIGLCRVMKHEKYI